MSEVALIGVMAVVTYGSRAVLLVRKGPTPGGVVGRFLELFPLALFVAIATTGLAAPEGTPEVTPALAGAAGGIAGAALTRRSLVGTVVIGAAAYWLARRLAG